MPQPFTASGQISPRRFVNISGSFLVAQCGAGTQIEGVSQPGTWGAPNTGQDDGFAANPSATPPVTQLQVFQIGETTLLDCGRPVTAGNFLKSDANGMGVPVTTNLDYYGAIAAESSAASGSAIRVTVQPGRWGA